VLHMGPLGCANVAKIAKNFVTGSERFVVQEALRICEAGGVDWQKAIAMMSEVYGEHVLAHWQRAFDASAPEPELTPTTILFDKDIPLAGELAGDYGLDLPIVRDVVAAARQASKGWNKPASAFVMLNEVKHPRAGTDSSRGSE